MNRVVAILLAGGCLLIGQYGIGVGQECDLIGVFGDRDGENTSLRIGAREPFSVYLAVIRPSTPSGILGWECTIEHTPNVEFVRWSLPVGALNISIPPKFAVGLVSPLARADAVVLAEAVCVVTDNSPACIRVGPYPESSVDPPVPVYAVHDEDGRCSLLSLTAASGAEQINVFSINAEGQAQPKMSKHVLHGNLPNPFNPRTSLCYELFEPCRVQLRVYDVSGRLVRILRNSVHEIEGIHEVVWLGLDDAGRSVASGTYFYRLTAGGYTETKRMVLLK
jgi:hypothetical protein